MSEINEIAKALVAAHAELKNPPLDSTNPHFKSKFASLAGVRDTVAPVLAKHGLCVFQDLKNTERGVACTTIITHASGQQITLGPLEIPATKPDAQGLGSAATYARRYALMAAFSVVGDVDDDANAAVGTNGGAKLSAQQLADLDALIEEVGADKKKVCEWAGVEKLSEFPMVRLKACIKMLEAKRIAPQH